MAGLWVSAQSKAIPRRAVVNKYVIGQCPIIQTRRSTRFLFELCAFCPKLVSTSCTHSLSHRIFHSWIDLSQLRCSGFWGGWLAAQTSSEILRMADDGIV